MFANALQQRLDLVILHRDQQRYIPFAQEAALAADASDAKSLGSERF
jgi:hypothetical protein